MPPSRSGRAGATVAPASIPCALAAVAAELGADVPFFLLGGTALGSGRGDRLEPWPDGLLGEVVLAMPDFGVSTPEAYRWFDERGRPACCRRTGVAPPARLAWPPGSTRCRNDLGPGVAERHPVIAALQQASRAGGRPPVADVRQRLDRVRPVREAGAADRAADASVRLGVAASPDAHGDADGVRGARPGGPGRSGGLPGDSAIV